MQGGRGGFCSRGILDRKSGRGTCATGSVGRRFYYEQAEKPPRIWWCCNQRQKLLHLTAGRE